MGNRSRRRQNTNHRLIEDVRQARYSATECAIQLGLKVVKSRAHCPGPAHSNGDRRPSMSLGRGPNARKWYCPVCDVGGDAIEMCRFVTGATFWEALRMVAGWAGVDCSSSDHAPRRRRARRQRAKERAADSAATTTNPYPARDEVAALWQGCVSPLEDECAMLFLGSRLTLTAGDDLALADVARVLPQNIALPRWAVCGGRPWNESEHRLILPLFDADGTMRSVLARHIAGGAGPKSLVPAGVSSKGLIMVDPVAHAVRARLINPDWVVIAEGEMDFLTTYCAFADERHCEHAPGVLGVRGGGWTEAHANAIPSGTQVVIATDPDVPGARMAKKIAATLGHCRVAVDATLNEALGSPKR